MKKSWKEHILLLFRYAGEAQYLPNTTLKYQKANLLISIHLVFIKGIPDYLLMPPKTNNKKNILQTGHLEYAAPKMPLK
jgi:hypothetical protein